MSGEISLIKSTAYGAHLKMESEAGIIWKTESAVTFRESQTFRVSTTQWKNTETSHAGLGLSLMGEERV